MLEPVKKSDIIKNNDATIVDNLILLINMRLSSGHFTYHVSELKFLLSKTVKSQSEILNEVIRAFQKAGWTVQHEKGHDPRDGNWDYLQFS